MKSNIGLVVSVILFATQLGLAQPADYLLERVAIHAKLVRAKTPGSVATKSLKDLSSNEPVVSDLNTTLKPSHLSQNLFANNLSTLIQDLESWKDSLPSKNKKTYDRVRIELENYQGQLKTLSQRLSLNREQSAHLELLFLELELAAANIDSEYVRTAQRKREARQGRRAGFNFAVGPAWNAWGGPWGGWGGWGAGPYFGQPFGPGFGPRCW